MSKTYSQLTLAVASEMSMAQIGNLSRKGEIPGARLVPRHEGSTEKVWMYSEESLEFLQMRVAAKQERKLNALAEGPKAYYKSPSNHAVSTVSRAVETSPRLSEELKAAFAEELEYIAAEWADRAVARKAKIEANRVANGK